MTTIEQRAAESLAKNLPLVLKELKRANKLKALSVRFGIEQKYKESDGIVATSALLDYERQLESIMEGIS